MKYSIAIEPGSDSQAWGVVVPELPGCYSAADKSIDQATENAKEATWMIVRGLLGKAAVAILISWPSPTEAVP